MGSCCGGGGGGPIIVRPDINLDNVTVDTGPDREFQVLCDADGLPFLRRYSVAADGGTTVVDTALDGTTGFSPAEPVGVCSAVADESPGEPAQVGGPQTVVLCDADGAAFVRTYQLSAEGQITGYVDTTLGGESYAPADPVGVCPPGGDESPPEPCGDTEVLLLCDTDGDNRTQFLRHITTGCDGTVTSVADTELDGTTAYTPAGTVGVCPGECGDTTVLPLCDRIPDPDGGPTEIVRFLRRITYDCDGQAVTVTDTGLDGTTAYTVQGEVGDCAPVVTCGDCDTTPADGEANSSDGVFCDPPPASGIVPLPGGGAALWGGGSLTIPADPDASAGNGWRVNRAVTAAIQADRPACDDGTAKVTISVQVCNDGPNPAPSDYSGSLCLFVNDCVEVLPHAFLTAPVGPGECQTLNITVPVPADALAAGRLNAILDVNTYSEDGPKSWTLSDWQVTYEYGQEGCPDDPCPESLSVKLCEPVTFKMPDPELQKCNSVFTLEGCDDVNGDGSEIVHYTELWCSGPQGALQQLHTFRGSPRFYYDPTNPVPCEEPEPSTCGLPVDAVTSGEANSGQPGELQVVDVQPPPLLQYRGQPTGKATHEPLPGGGQTLWDGGTLVFPADTEGAGGGELHYVNRVIAAQLIAARPECDDGTAQITVQVHAQLDGPNPGVGKYYGGLRLYNSRTGEYFAYDPVAVEGAKPQPGYAHTMSLTSQVLAQDLANGNILVWLALETYETPAPDRDPADGPKQWTTSDFQASYSYGTEGCSEEGPTLSVRLCEPITIRQEPQATDLSVTTRTVIERRACDDTDGDGQPDTQYSELWEVGGNQPPTLIGTYTTADLAQEYDPTNPVPCLEPEPITCGMPPDDVTSGSANSGEPGELQVVDNTGAIHWTCAHLSRDGGGQTLWDGQPLKFGPDPDGQDECESGARYLYRDISAQLIAARPSCDDGTAQITVQVHVELQGDNPAGYTYFGGLRLYNARTEEWFASDLVTSPDPQHLQPGHQETLNLQAQVLAQDLADGSIYTYLALETWEDIPGGSGQFAPTEWTASDFQASYSYNTDGCMDELPLVAVKVCEPITTKYQIEPAGGAPLPTTGGLVPVPRWDDADGDGRPDTPFTEVWQMSPGQPPALVDTYRSQPGDGYQPINPVEPEPPSPVVSTGGQRIQADGGQEVVDVAGSVGRLLSATVTVITGEATVTTDSGSLPIPAGASLTWGTSDPGQQLSTLVVTVPDGGDALVHYTHQGQAGQVVSA